MNTIRQAPDRTGWLLASAVLLVSAGLGLIDLKNVSFSGFVTPSYSTVTQVISDSPAEEAGFRVGDRIVTWDGVAASDLNALWRQPRAAIGETRTFVVEREGLSEPLELRVSFAAQTIQNKVVTVGSALIGLTFLLCGIGTYLRAPEARTRVLALLGICGMAGFSPLAYVPHGTTRLALAVLPVIGITMMPALLLHFLLGYPRPRRITRLVLGWLYVPVAVAGIIGAVTLVIEARLLPVARVALFAVIVLQLLFAIGLLIREYFRTDRESRTAYGLNALLVGFLGGLIPVLAAGFIPILPGGQFYFLTIVLLPLTLVYSLFRAANSLGETLLPQFS